MCLLGQQGRNIPSYPVTRATTEEACFLQIPNLLQALDAEPKSFGILGLMEKQEVTCFEILSSA